jgi:hypothetical protein
MLRSCSTTEPKSAMSALPSRQATGGERKPTGIARGGAPGASQTTNGWVLGSPR